MWTLNQTKIFGNKHIRFIPWYIKLLKDNFWIWENDVVKSCMHYLPWIDLESNCFLRAIEPTLEAELNVVKQNLWKGHPPEVPIPNTNDLQIHEPSLTEEQGKNPKTRAANK
jgi:hypothetical protein